MVPSHYHKEHGWHVSLRHLVPDHQSSRNEAGSKAYGSMMKAFLAWFLVPITPTMPYGDDEAKSHGPNSYLLRA